MDLKREVGSTYGGIPGMTELAGDACAGAATQLQEPTMPLKLL